MAPEEGMEEVDSRWCLPASGGIEPSEGEEAVGCQNSSDRRWPGPTSWRITSIILTMRLEQRWVHY